MGNTLLMPCFLSVNHCCTRITALYLQLMMCCFLFFFWDNFKHCSTQKEGSHGNTTENENYHQSIEYDILMNSTLVIFLFFLRNEKCYSLRAGPFVKVIDGHQQETWPVKQGQSKSHHSLRDWELAFWLPPNCNCASNFQSSICNPYFMSEWSTSITMAGVEKFKWGCKGVGQRLATYIKSNKCGSTLTMKEMSAVWLLVELQVASFYIVCPGVQLILSYM